MLAAPVKPNFELHVDDSTTVLEFQGLFRNYAFISPVPFLDTRVNNKGSKQGKGLQPYFSSQKLLSSMSSEGTKFAY